jgi:hypothetical protein
VLSCPSASPPAGHGSLVKVLTGGSVLGAEGAGRVAARVAAMRLREFGFCPVQTCGVALIILPE